MNAAPFFLRLINKIDPLLFIFVAEGVGLPWMETSFTCKKNFPFVEKNGGLPSLTENCVSPETYLAGTIRGQCENYKHFD